VAEKLDSRTILLQYFEALRRIAEAPSTKIVLPMELFKLIAPLEKLSKLVKGSAEES